MKWLFGIMLILASLQSHSALVIKQRYTDRLYLEVFATTHMDTVETFFNQQLAPYNCIGGNLTYKVLKEMESRWFGNDIPGIIQYDFQTYCQNDAITGFQFGYEPAGYDEDYTQMVMKITTKTSLIKKRYCLYATRNVMVNCYPELTELTKLSVTVP